MTGACGPLRIPLAGELGPDYAGGTAPASRPSGRRFNWEAHPAAWIVVAVFLVILARKAMS